jgi:hypothetical protein
MGRSTSEGRARLCEPRLRSGCGLRDPASQIHAGDDRPTSERRHIPIVYRREGSGDDGARGTADHAESHERQAERIPLSHPRYHLPGQLCGLRAPPPSPPLF